MVPKRTTRSHRFHSPTDTGNSQAEDDLLSADNELEVDEKTPTDDVTKSEEKTEKTTIENDEEGEVEGKVSLKEAVDVGDGVRGMRCYLGCIGAWWPQGIKFCLGPVMTIDPGRWDKILLDRSLLERIV